MGRHNRRRKDDVPAASDRPAERHEEWSDGEWAVRSVTGSASTKAYRCPGCDHEIRPATPHVVAWPVDGPVDAHGAGLQDRRHWHTACWQARGRRSPRARRPR